MIDIRTIEWVAGFLEGEACFGFYDGRPSIQVSQVQQWPLLRLQRLFGGNIGQRKRVQERHRLSHYWHLPSARAVGLMMTVYALLSPNRQERIRDILLSWQSRGPHHRYYTHCRHGHAFDEANTIYRPDGNRRRCRICRDRQNKERSTTANVTEAVPYGGLP